LERCCTRVSNILFATIIYDGNTTCNHVLQKARAEAESEAKGEHKDAIAEEFPAGSHLDPYGFIFMRKRWLQDLGCAKGMRLEIEKNPDGSITVCKA